MPKVKLTSALLTICVLSFSQGAEAKPPRKLSELQPSREVVTTLDAEEKFDSDAFAEESNSAPADDWYPLTDVDDLWDRRLNEILEDEDDTGTTLLTGAEEYAPFDQPTEELAPGPCCDTVCCDPCPEFWEHRSGIWGEFLWLRARGADVAYATPVDGTLATSVPVGSQALAGFDYDPGFRIGAAWAIDSCSSFTLNYTWFKGSSEEDVAVPGGGSFLRADTVHPNTVNVAGDSLAARAFYNIDLQTADFNYKAIVTHNDCFVINYLVGVKYARLDQEFRGLYTILGDTSVDSNVLFDGTGPRFGLETERLLGCKGFLFYTRGNVNFLVGNAIADYTQTNVFAGTQAVTGLTESRIVTVPELELGAGWQNCCGNFRITAGYYLSAWFNMMTMPEYLSVVRTTPNTFEPQQKTLTLDGLNVRAEYRF